MALKDLHCWASLGLSHHAALWWIIIRTCPKVAARTEAPTPMAPAPAESPLRSLLGREPVGASGQRIAIDAIRQSWPMAPAETMARLVRTASIVQRVPGPILSEAEFPSHVVLILEGTVAATLDSPDGRSTIPGLYGPGQFVGLATLTGAPSAAGLDAITDVTLVAWATTEFRQIVASDLAMALDLLERSAYAVHALHHLIKVRTFTSARSRLAGLLLKYESYCFSTDTPLVSRPRLSDLAGVTPRTVSTILRQWEAAGIVRRIGSSGLELIDRAALAANAALYDEFPPPDPALRGARIVPTVAI